MFPCIILSVDVKINNMINIFYIINIYLIKNALADYCEFGACNEDQYCCGENKCCKKTVDVWYFWAGIFLIVIAILVVICLYIRRKKRHKYGNYDLLNQDKEPPT